LYRTTLALACERERIDRAGRDAAVCVNENDAMGRAVAQVLKGKVEGEAFAASRGVMPFNDLSARSSGDSGGVVIAIVRHDQEPVAWAQLRLGVSDGGQQGGALIVGRNDNGERATRHRAGFHRLRRPGLHKGRKDLNHENGCQEGDH
jgi:hypothetical protein